MSWTRNWVCAYLPEGRQEPLSAGSGKEGMGQDQAEAKEHHPQNHPLLF